MKWGIGQIRRAGKKHPYYHVQHNEEQPEEEPASREEIEAEIQKILDEPEISREDTVFYYLRTGSLPSEVGTLSEPAIWAMITEVIASQCGQGLTE